MAPTPFGPTYNIDTKASQLPLPAQTVTTSIISKHANVWYTVDDTTTLVRRELTHMLPAVAFFELMSDPPDVDWAVCDPGALSRAPAWIQSALEILSALQMDGEWLLGLSEAEQVTVAQVTSAKDAGGALSETVLDDVHELLAGGAMGNGLRCFRYAFLPVRGNDG